MGVPNLSEAETAIKHAQEEADFWAQHYPAFVKQYPEQFVAVHQGQVVAASPDLQELLQQLRTLGIDLNTARVRYITADPQRFLL